MRSLRHRRAISVCAFSFVGASVMALAPSAHAQVIERFALHGELGAGTMFPEYQRERLNYGVGIQGSVRLGFSLVDLLAIQVSGSSAYFPNDAGGGQQWTVSGGLRFEPRLGRVGRLFVDANGGVAFTGDLTRPAFDAGLGFEFALHPAVGLGPMFRYSHLFASGEQDYQSDAQYWMAGLSLSLRVPRRERVAPPPPTDTDHDGVFDPVDQCPLVAAGEHPDPARPGCPLADSDGDGVFDPQDLCVHEAAGEHPDPERLGCPLRDADSDGVLDPQDLCPTIPQGATPDPERPGCPDGDDDLDTVVNHIDQCRTVPQGRHPDPARPGCPAPDRDGDAIPDPVDACPDRPGAPSTDPRRNGCPGLVRIENGQIRILRPVYFATGRDVILPRSRPVLQAVAEALRAETGIQHIMVEGHTDDVADDAFNMDLSQRRAESVRTFLVAAGISPDRLQSHGYGETRPVVPGHSRAARAANRRVEFHILDAPASDNAASAAPPAPSAAP